MPIEARTLAALLDERRGLSLLLALSSAGCLGLPRYGDDTADGDTGGTTQRPAPGTADTTLDPTGDRRPDFGLPSATSVAPPDLGVNPYANCRAYAYLTVSCYGNDDGESYAYCVEYVQYAQANFPECVPLLDEFLACISSLDCEQLGNGGGEACNSLIEAFFNCQQGG